ncbi:MAG: sulfur carrier protein ThiS [Eubacteriales bacterium]|uniref:sulfur carrier protein ThiS n=1 Tax=Baileyella intestinalis TaxID=2606709 RepID=UPI0023F0C213|nr:sulfur carrier protein ThiS [Baileyella intestinalis]MDD5874593.1 sulfur carrier protein ThiS [Baileyella intestinalis]
MVKINGEMTDAAGSVLEDILVEKGFNMKFIAVEINEHIVKKADYPETILQDGDTVEVVSFVSGG